MNSIVKDEYLSKKNRVKGEGFDTGILENNVGELNRRGFNVDKGELVGRFDGVRTFLAFVNSGIDYGNEARGRTGSSHARERDEDWTKYDTYEKAMEAMIETPQVFRQFEEADLKLKDYEQPDGFELDFDVTGDFMDIGRVIEGQPENFGTMRNGRVTNKFASIVLAGMSNAGISESEIQERANLTLRLVDMLESNNVRCKVTVLYSNDNWHCEVIAKQYKDVLDIDDLSVATSADFFRRAQFYFAEHSKTRTSSYGRAENVYVKTVKDEDADITIAVGNNYHRSVPYWDNRGWKAQFSDLEHYLLDNGFQHGDTAELLNDGLVYNGSQIRNDERNG